MLRTKREPTFLSLFSGSGGLDLGFLHAGFKCHSAWDEDVDAVATYTANIRSHPCYAADLRNWQQLDFLPKVDLVVAGPPCQGFSTAGGRRPGDSRNALLGLPADVALSVGARLVVIENVPGALAALHAPHWAKLERRLVGGGFRCRLFTIDSSATGLPQLRRRVVFVGVRSKQQLPAWDVRLTPTPTSLGSVLQVPAGASNHAPRPLPPGTQAAQIAPYIGQGQKLSNVRSSASCIHTWQIPDVFGRVTGEEKSFLEAFLHLRRQQRRRSWGDADPVGGARLRAAFGRNWERMVEGLVAKNYLKRCPRGSFDLRHTFNGKFRRLDPGRPTPSVLTKFCQPEYFLHPFEDRAFTVREAARIQGFPDDFKFLGSARSQAVQVGNAVPPPLARTLARWVREQL